MNWRHPLWISVAGVLLAAVVLALAVRRNSFDLELVDEYIAGGGDEEPADQPLE